MKIIMPMARPATVSVTQVGRHRDQRQRHAARAPGSARAESRSRPAAGRQCVSAVVAHWCASSDRPSSRCCSASSAASSAIVAAYGRCGRRPSPRPCRRARARNGNSARPAGWWCRCASARGRPRSCAAMIAGASPLVGSSISSSLRGSIDGAGDREHLLLPARQRAGRRAARISSAREKVRRSTPGASSSIGPLRAASTRFSRTVRSAKMPIVSGT